MNDKRVLAVILFLAFLGLMAWFFSDVLIYMFVALILTVLGRPCMKLLSKIKIKDWQFPDSLAATLTLVFIVGIFGLVVFFLFPLVASDLQKLLSFSPESLAANIGGWFKEVEIWLKQQDVLRPGDDLSALVVSYLSNLLDGFSFANLFGNAMSMVSAVCVGLLAVLFMSFFSLKDNQIFFKMIRRLIPVSYRSNYDHILNASLQQITRYFTGVFIEMIIMGVLEGLFCYFLKIPNALIIGFLGGLLNVIPYVGPLIGGALGVVISVTSLLASGVTGSLILWTGVKVIAVFVVCNLIDNFILQPYIYGRSVHAHPLEIFIVILIGAHIGGVIGMILAVPAYSLLRIIIKELFGDYYGNGKNNEIVEQEDKFFKEEKKE